MMMPHTHDAGLRRDVPGRRVSSRGRQIAAGVRTVGGLRGGD